MPRFPLAVVSVLFAVSAASAQDPSLAKKLEALMDGPDYKQATWGVLVSDAKTGQPVYARNADSLMTPASVTKLFSCAAALVAIGPDATVETGVFQRGTVTDGILKGDLILLAAGDVMLGGRTNDKGEVVFRDSDHIYSNFSGEAHLTDTNPLAGLEDLAKQVKAKGIQEVTGEVLIDDRLFERAAGSGSGPDAISPVVVNDNLVDVLVTPGKAAGDPAKVKLIPETDFLRADIEVVTGSKGSAPRLVIETIDAHHFRVRGSIAVDSKPRLRIYPVSDPAGFARGLFVEALRRAGVRVNANVLRPTRVDLPEQAGCRDLTQVAAIRSAKFRDTIKVTLKVSHNLYAGTLPCLVAAKHDKKTAAAGLLEQGKILKGLGVEVPTISFGGGAGGHWADCVTPRATVALLDAMRKRPEWDAYKDGLPVLGVDGTLAEVVPKESPARGKVFAKTGTLVYDDNLNGRSLLRSKALAGVMTTAKGTELTVALFVNNVPLPKGVTATREGKMLGKLCEVIHEHGP
jgi:D-alanyl-D-alanine carboxypeptidase/D-alanyl-D-alanine-endopeptidase (penicillin-binding protein 4)